MRNRINRSAKPMSENGTTISRRSRPVSSETQPESEGVGVRGRGLGAGGWGLGIGAGEAQADNKIPNPKDQIPKAEDFFDPNAAIRIRFSPLIRYLSA